MTYFVMDCFYGYRLAEFPQTNKSVVKLAQSFRIERKIQDCHFEISTHHLEPLTDARSYYHDWCNILELRNEKSCVLVRMRKLLPREESRHPNPEPRVSHTLHHIISTSHRYNHRFQRNTSPTI